MFESIFFQAVCSTLAVLFSILFLLRAGMNITPKLRARVLMVTGAIALFYLADLFFAYLLGVSLMNVVKASSMGIGIRLIIIGTASFNLLLDISTIEKVKTFSAGWPFGISLILVLSWLFFELLSLEALLASLD